MSKKITSVSAGAAAVAASALFYYSFVKWIPALYVLSIVLYALAAGLLTARFTTEKPVLRGAIDFDIDVPAMSEFGRRTPDQVKP